MVLSSTMLYVILALVAFLFLVVISINITIIVLYIKQFKKNRNNNKVIQSDNINESLDNNNFDSNQNYNQLDERNTMVFIDQNARNNIVPMKSENVQNNLLHSPRNEIVLSNGQMVPTTQHLPVISKNNVINNQHFLPHSKGNNVNNGKVYSQRNVNFRPDQNRNKLTVVN